MAFLVTRKKEKAKKTILVNLNILCSILSEDFERDLPLDFFLAKKQNEEIKKDLFGNILKLYICFYFIK